MDVTIENFISLLPQIGETIRNCDFIAIDTELTGLMRDRSNNRYDLPEDRFVKIVTASRGYVIIQFGIACFTRCDDANYTCRTYNFYIFPQTFDNEFDMDRTFSAQSQAINFLIQHNFDFNKLFKHGVSYLAHHEKSKLTDKLKSENKMEARRIQPSKSPKSHKIPKTIEERKAEFASAKGFLEVIEMIIFHKKPIVGHNLMLDLIQIINQFIQPLDTDYQAFKDTLKTLFPLIYDTKYIAHDVLEKETLINNQSRLYELYCQCKENLTKVNIQHLGEFFDENQLPHQAGYDAFMSGYCFLAICGSYLNENQRCKLEKSESGSKSPSLVRESRIESMFGNRIYLAHSYDFKYYNIGGDEAKPNRDHLFYCVFPSTWTHEDLFQLFSKVGGVTVGRIDPTSAVCALRDASNASLVKMLLTSMNAEGSIRNYKVYTYEHYLSTIRPRLMQGGDA